MYLNGEKLGVGGGRGRGRGGLGDRGRGGLFILLVGRGVFLFRLVLFYIFKLLYRSFFVYYLVILKSVLVVGILL